MGYSQNFPAIFAMGTILGLILLGFIIVARSGVVNTSGPSAVHLFLSNLSQALIRVFGYLVGLVAVQQFIGFPLGFIW